MKIYLDNYLIKEINNRFVITDLKGNILDNNYGLGYRTKNRAYHVIQNSLEKKLYKVKLGF